MLAVYSLSHFLVDFSCAFLIYSRFLNPWQWTLSLVLYNFFAFAMQAPLGLLGDFLNRNAILAAAGCLIVATSAGLSRWAVAACIVAGLGNALFHLGGGIDTLNESREKCGKLGVFVSPGAFGIYFGTILGKQRSLPVWPVVAALLLSALGILFIASRKNLLKHSENVPVSFSGFRQRDLMLAAFCFFFVVILRALAGNTMSFPWKTGIWGFIMTCAVVLGKTCGGFLADRFGALRSTVVTLALSAVLFLFGDNPVCGTAAVFLFNMTMPVTCWAIARMLPDMKGFTFGILTLALFLGLVPVIWGWITPGLPYIAFSGMAVVSAIMLVFGLKRGRIC